MRHLTTFATASFVLASPVLGHHSDAALEILAAEDLLAEDLAAEDLAALLAE